MKKILITMFIIINISPFLFADDGGTSNPENWSYGNIYVKKENKDIALENEVMLVKHCPDDSKDSLIKCLFDFKNTSSQDITVDCAFPVRISLPYTEDKETGKINCGQKFNCRINKTAWNLAFGVPKGKTLSFTNNSNNEDLFITKDKLKSADKNLYTLPYKDFLSWCRTEWYRDQNSQYVNPDFKTIQDGKNISIQTVGIETTVLSDHILLVLHFYYKLFFPANKNSTVQNSYYPNAKIIGKRRSEIYQTEYDISTGGTWKGSIKNFILVTDGQFERCGGNSKNSFEISPLYIVHKSEEHESNEFQSGFYGFTICCIKNYKPISDEYFRFTYGYPYLEEGTFLGDKTKDILPGKQIYQNFIKDITSSSFLTGTFKFHDANSDYLNDSWNKKESGYEPQTSFDGFMQNGWVEGVKGDGIGEWIQFTLTKPAFGPFAVNGLNSTINSYINNRRIKTAGLYKGTKKITTLQFSDKLGKSITEYINFTGASTQNDLWLQSNAIENTLFLDKGTYRIQIESVYSKYAKYNDTVLGEIWFYPVGNVLMDIIKNSKFCAVPVETFLHKQMWKEDHTLKTEYWEK